jgi:hypothetical protein
VHNQMHVDHDAISCFGTSSHVVAGVRGQSSYLVRPPRANPSGLWLVMPWYLTWIDADVGYWAMLSLAPLVALIALVFWYFDKPDLG